MVQKQTNEIKAKHKNKIRITATKNISEIHKLCVEKNNKTYCINLKKYFKFFSILFDPFHFFLLCYYLYSTGHNSLSFISFIRLSLPVIIIQTHHHHTPAPSFCSSIITMDYLSVYPEVNQFHKAKTPNQLK